MATIETICKFNQSGFCKFLSHCRKQHVMDICPTNQCNIKTCLLRHPKLCKYFFNSGRCKFNGQCAYLHHQTKSTVELEISELESKLEEMKTKIKDIENLQLRLDQHETELKTFVDEKVQHILKETQNQQNSCENVNKIENLEEKLKELSENFYILLGSVDDLERTTKLLKHHLETLSEQTQNFKCNFCGQVFQTEQIVSEHIRRHHKTSKT